jgi:hypothetical protein
LCRCCLDTTIPAQLGRHWDWLTIWIRAPRNTTRCVEGQRHPSSLKKLLKSLFLTSELSSFRNPAKDISITSETLSAHAQIGIVLAS